MDIPGFLESLGSPLDDEKSLPLKDLLWLLDRFGLPWRLRCRLQLPVSRVVVGLEGVTQRPAVSVRSWWDTRWVEASMQVLRQVREDAWDAEVEYCESPWEELFVEIDLDGRSIEVPIQPAVASLVEEHGWSEESAKKVAEMTVRRKIVRESLRGDS